MDQRSASFETPACGFLRMRTFLNEGIPAGYGGGGPDPLCHPPLPLGPRQRGSSDSRGRKPMRRHTSVFVMAAALGILSVPHVASADAPRSEAGPDL